MWGTDFWQEECFFPMMNPNINSIFVLLFEYSLPVPLILILLHVI